MMSKGFKRGSKPRTISPAVVHAWAYGRFIDVKNNLKRKKLQRMNQGSNFLGGSFSNRDYVRAPMQFGRESKPIHLKR